MCQIVVEGNKAAYDNARVNMVSPIELSFYLYLDEVVQQIQSRENIYRLIHVLPNFTLPQVKRDRKCMET